MFSTKFIFRNIAQYNDKTEVKTEVKTETKWGQDIDFSGIQGEGVTGKGQDKLGTR